ncbi:helix-turn-helix domain-containing protein [Paenibacillus sp. DR312]|uniref:helix-turn-helix domain-containing protein n=1 Tax=unclassified Paenibacillus TaxID=185978 RepID=UPI0021BBEF41|nr:helix-turn-helix domain-containing protein [Paenibacillus sp. DR312]
MEIADKILELMKENGVTKYRLAKETGVSYTGVTKILSGQTKHPQIDSIKLIADYFNKPLTYFTDEANPNQANEVPEWATSKDKRDFKKMLEDDGELMFDGVPLDENDKNRIKDMLTGLFWEAKQMNKQARKKSKDNNE